MRLITFTTITIIFISLILPGILSFGIRNIPQNNQPSLDRTQKLYGDLIISQVFISTTDNFSGIGVSIKNPNLLNKKDVILSIHDRDGNLLRVISLNGANIADGKFVKFRFAPIEISENRQFLFTLTAPTTTQDEADGNRALEVFLTNQQPANAFDLTIEDKVILGTSISYVAFYKPPYPTYVLEIIYSKWIKNFTQDTLFFVIYMALIFTLSGFLLYQLSKPRQNR